MSNLFREKRIVSIVLYIVVATSIFLILPFLFSNSFAANADTTTRYLKTTAENLNLRSDAGTEFKSFYKVKKGTKFTSSSSKIAKDGATWYLVKYNSNPCYLIAKYASTYRTVTKYSQTKKGLVKSTLNVRTGPAATYKKVGSLSTNKIIDIKGKARYKGADWYLITFYGATRYISASYVTGVSSSANFNAFEAQMTAEGFPESYKKALRILKAAHPNWEFKSQKTNLPWSTVLAAEKLGSRSLVSPSSPTTWRSSVDKKTYSGGWYVANEAIIKYYLDPRNFLNDTGIYQFMSLGYQSSTQSALTVKTICTGTFMATAAACDNKNYWDVLFDAGKNNGVNPNVLASMIKIEQGTKGTSDLISGKYPGYTNLYNFFNYWATGTTETQVIVNGLKFAQTKGWTTRTSSINGGAALYAEGYVKKGQNTLYLKKFDVMRGSTYLATHQYMQNIEAAYYEGATLKKASSSKETFLIPLYNTMPTSPSSKPK
ncbi:MAG: N-acetylglucosaminidase [Anaerovoracaceae bacterium]